MRRTMLVWLVVTAACCGIVAAAFGLARAPGSPYAVGGDSVVFSPDGRWLATTGEGLSILRVDTRSGRLQQVAHRSFPAGGPEVVAFSPDGGLLAVASNDIFGKNELFLFAINRNTGALRRAPRFSLTVPSAIDSVAFSPNGRFLAVAECVIRMFAVNRRTGALRELPHSPYPIGDSCAGNLRFNPRGNLLAAAHGFGDGVWVYTMNLRTGRLRKVTASRDATESLAEALAFSPDGRLLIVTRFYDNALTALWVDQRSGALRKVSGSPFRTGSLPSDASFTPDGRLLAIATDNSVSLLSVDQTTGGMTNITGSPFRTGPFTTAARFSPDGRFLAVGNGIRYGEERVSVFLTPSPCNDPDHDDDCD